MDYWVVMFVVVSFISFFQSLFLACFVLLLSTIWLCLNFLILGNSWLVFILALTYVGGVLVLFVYMCSLSTSMKIESDNMVYFLGLIIFSLFIMFIYPVMSQSYSFLSIFSINSFYSKFDLGIATLTAMYLTLGLLISMHLVEKFSGPLKQYF